MFHVHSSCISNMKNFKGNMSIYLTKANVSSKYRVESQSIKSNDNDLLN